MKILQLKDLICLNHYKQSKVKPFYSIRADIKGTLVAIKEPIGVCELE